MLCNIGSFVNRRKPVRVSFFYSCNWLLPWWWKVHPNAANVLRLRRVPAAPRWHLKVSACGWLADLHGNTSNPNAAPGPTTSAALPPPWGPIRHVPHPHPHRSSLVKITGPVVFVLNSLPPSNVDRSLHWSEKVRSHPDVWESVYFFSNWIGKTVDLGWGCTWESVC